MTAIPPVDLGSGLAARPPLPSEVPALASAFAAMEPWRRYPYDPEELATYFTQSEPDAPRLALTVGGELAGLVGVHWTWLRGPYLQFLGILPAFQQRGVGSAVLQWLSSEASTRGARNAFVCVSEFNAPARRFYEAHAFVEVGRLPDLVKDGITEVLMRRQLGVSSLVANRVS